MNTSTDPATGALAPGRVLSPDRAARHRAARSSRELRGTRAHRTPRHDGTTPAAPHPPAREGAARTDTRPPGAPRPPAGLGGGMAAGLALSAW
ncbi:hypothetical protein [Streptomyces sp. NPDC002564]|uniref:hypothetical protein n=1 Tax=Streptomyces sp. NPDC002564 TaxID=3364649 RepID=UPI0036CA1BA5